MRTNRYSWFVWLGTTVVAAVCLAGCAYTPNVHEGWAIQIAQKKAWELDGQFTNWEMRGKVPWAFLHGPENPAAPVGALQAKLEGKHYWKINFSSYGPTMEHALVIFVDAESGDIVGYFVH